MGRKRSRTADASKVVGLVRVSKEEQSLSPEAQRDALARWCADAGAELVAVHEDIDVSGGAPLDKRPGLLAALTDLREFGAGVLLGSVPYGYRLADDGTHLEPDELEQRTVALVRRYRDDGLTLRAIGQRLARKGIRPRSGKRWHPQTVARIAEAA